MEVEDNNDAARDAKKFRISNPRCSNCSQAGHRNTTCPLRLTEDEQTLDDEFDETQTKSTHTTQTVSQLDIGEVTPSSLPQTSTLGTTEVSFLSSETSGPKNLKRVYKCSICKQTKHRANRCPSRQPAAIAPSSPTKHPLIVTKDTSGTDVPEVSSEMNFVDLPEESSEMNFKGIDEDLCPYCEDPFPTVFSKRLQTLKATLDALPNSMSLTFPQTADFCALHRAERDVIPFGRKEGWPVQIDFRMLDK
ncbi:hypothetical protein DFH28DRAFT_882802 [Melampsora americana]|nr:hypothetical protein DFH28DRAFT_882802 [Melampsora americana]